MSGLNHKAYVVGIVVTLAMSACAAPATPAPASGPLAVTQAFETFFNKHEVDNAAALFVDNPVWNLERV